MYHPDYVEIPLTREQAESILQTQYSKEEADLLCFLAQAYKDAATNLEHEVTHDQPTDMQVRQAR